MANEQIKRVAFYFSAHPDDWQLFMNPPASQDVLDEDCRCVFIHMTAGDAGYGLEHNGGKHPFYVARENGAETAVRYIADAAVRYIADANERPPAEADVSVVTFKGHAIRRLRYRNTAAYFLRLPDGSPAGSGYATTGYQSLTRLANGEIDTMTAVDGTAVYRGWDDLTSMLRGIIEFERAPDRAVNLHVPESNPAFNAGDHADHYMTAKAALAAAADIPARVVHHVGYACRHLPENLPAADREMKRAVFAATLQGVSALGHQFPWPEDDVFIGRNYCRIEEISH